MHMKKGSHLKSVLTASSASDSACSEQLLIFLILSHYILKKDIKGYSYMLLYKKELIFASSIYLYGEVEVSSLLLFNGLPVNSNSSFV